MYRNKEDSISLSAVLSKIKSADDIEISKIIEAVVERYSLVCPDWEVMFYFLPSADTEERRLYAENLIDYLIVKKIFGAGAPMAPLCKGSCQFAS